MKKSLLLVLWLGLTMMPLMAQKELLEASVENLKGETIDIRSTLKDGVPVVLSFWGTTCKPCLMELDALADVYEDWQQEVKFKVVAVATDDSRAASKVKAMAGGRGWPFEVVLDKNQELKRAMNVNSIPFLYIIDKNGKVAYTHSGYTPGSELEILKVLKEITKEK